MNICPNCGYRHSGRDYAAELIDVPMPKREREVILRLSQAQGRIVPMHQIVDFLYGDEEDGGPEDARNCAQVHITKVRRKISPLGWVIEAERYRGYRLVRTA